MAPFLAHGGLLLGDPWHHMLWATPMTYVGWIYFRAWWSARHNERHDS